METVKKGLTENWVSVVIPAMSFIGGILLNTITKTVTLTEQIPTKSYVDAKVEEAKSEALRLSVEAKQYSDLKLQGAVSDMKSDVKSIAVKQDLMYEMMKARESKK